MLALKLLRQSIYSQNTLDAEDVSAMPVTSEDSDTNIPDPIYQSSTLGSRCKPLLMQTLEADNPKESAFSGIRKKFTEFINSSVCGWGYENINYIKIPPEFEVSCHLTVSKGKLIELVFGQITEYRYLKITYGSTVDWRETTDHLRCNPSFFSKPRYDYALIQFTQTAVAFVRFILIFTCHIPELGGTFEFALVQPFTRRTGASRRLDRDLNLIRIKATAWSSSIFILVASIVRSAVLAPDSENVEEFITFTYLDDDTFLRLKDATISGP